MYYFIKRKNLKQLKIFENIKIIQKSEGTDY